MEDNKNIIEQLQEKIEKLESEMDNIKSVLEIQDEDEFDYETFGKFSDEMKNNKDQFEFDIDELEDYSSEQMNEMYDDDMEPEFEDDGEEPEFESNGEEEEIVGTVPDFDWLRTHQSDEDEDLSDIVSSLNESLDMFNRFKKYN